MSLCKTREGGWHHPSMLYHCIAISNAFAINLSWCMSKKFITLKHSNIQGFHSQKLEKEPYSVYSTSLLLHHLRLSILQHYRILKYYTQIIFWRRWNTKPNDAVKVVKGLPHLCPCHRPNPRRGLVMYMRWLAAYPNCYLCHTII